MARASRTLPVVVVGGGPAGSVTAAALAQRGVDVVVLEREAFPRFRLGESLLPRSLDHLEELGLLPALRERYLPKYAARFHHEHERRIERFVFSDAFLAKYPHAFQVPRDDLDTLLLEQAGRLGADVRHGLDVDAVVFDGDRATGVRGKDAAGTPFTLDASVVVDATGRAALMTHARRDLARIADLDQTAIFTHVVGAPRRPGEEEGDIDIVLFRGGWLWVIPFRDGRTSVGAVVRAAWLREAKARGEARPAALFDAALREASAEGLVAGSTRLFEPRAVADFSYRVGTPRGTDWLSVGDAAGFVDPLFSTGVHVAVESGMGAARVLADAFARGGPPTADALAAEQARVRAGVDVFVDAVRAFYRGTLIDLLFAQNRRAVLRRALTSVLAGDVFDPTARWYPMMRAHLADLAA